MSVTMTAVRMAAKSKIRLPKSAGVPPKLKALHNGG
jgi:hypothetical protein